MKKHSQLEDPDYKSIILRLIEARREAGLSQLDVAKKLKKTQSFISKIEARSSHLDIMTFFELSKIYKKKVASFFEFL